VNRDIFIVCNSVDELGGVTTWSHRMAGLFAARGHRVHLIGITPAGTAHALPDGAVYPMTTLYDEHPPPAWRPRTLVDRLNAPARARQSRRRAGMREQARKLSQLFRAAGPHAVVIVAQVWAMEWVELADTGGLTVIGMSHESYRACERSSRYARVLRHYAGVDRFLALTREDADLWARAGMSNAGFMPNALPWLPARISARTEKTVATVARLSHEKGIDLLLDAWRLAVTENPGWVLHVHGAGEEEAELREQSVRLGVDASVRWMGPTRDVPGALSAASLFALPSRAEGFPLTLLEAMVSGLPCVAFDVAPGVRGIIDDGVDGFLAAPGNPRSFADRLGQLMGDGELRDTMGDRAARSVLRFAPEKVVKRWEELFAFLEY
jgi:glycosyltransferase involved in cell wall biosynthesis